MGEGGRVYTAREDSVYFWRIFTPDGNDVGEDGREGGRKGMMEEKEETCKECKKKQGTSTEGGQDREDTESTFLLGCLRRRRRIDW